MSSFTTTANVLSAQSVARGFSIMTGALSIMVGLFGMIKPTNFANSIYAVEEKQKKGHVLVDGDINPWITLTSVRNLSVGALTIHLAATDQWTAVGATMIYLSVIDAVDCWKSYIYGPPGAWIFSATMTPMLALAGYVMM